MKQIPPYSLIAKYLAQQCTAQEESELLEWREATTENEALFVELSNEWGLVNVDLLEKSYIPDKEKIWSKIQNQIKPLTLTYSKSFVLRVASIAASIALLIGLSFTFLIKNQEKYIPTLTTTFIAPQGQKSQLILADGTKVWLNSGSSLTYTNKFGLKDRTLQLKGEAFFDVTKNPQLKCMVQTEEVKVVVYGTAFNVRSYANDQHVSVSLLRGKVDVLLTENNKSIAVLKPGEGVVVNKSNLESKVEKADANLDGIWRLEKLKFEGASIVQVAEKLGKWYGMNIEVREPYKFPKYWFTVKSESINDLLKSMNGLQPIQYTIKGNQVEISIRQ